jgi:hypothetical protein
LDEAVAGVLLAVPTDGNASNNATITTGSISTSVTMATGANRIVFNTGIANQGRALAVAADMPFGN